MSQVRLALVRGGVIAGRVTDDVGEPVARVTVRALRIVGAGGGPTSLEPSSEERTDDLGLFRVFGLPPGVSLVGAFADAMMFGDAPPDEHVGYAPTYYPGTPSRAEAQRIRVTAGSEAPAVNLALVLLALPGCAVIGGVFKAGAWVGALAVIVVIGLVALFAAKISG